MLRRKIRQWYYSFFYNHIYSLYQSLLVDYLNIKTEGKLILIIEVRQMIMRNDKTVTGFNVGFNDGEDAGQTVFHCHIHVIPRRKDDVANPSG
jgi:diadenosine tetraphosphate (Ap4A) HIT family hydrolase